MRNVKINFRQIAIGVIASFFVVSSVGAIVGVQNFAYDYMGTVDYSKDPQFLAQGDVEINGDLFANNDKSFFSILPGKGAFLTLKNAASDSFSIGNDSGNFSILNKVLDPVLKLDQTAGLMNIYGPLKLVADGLHTFEIKNNGTEFFYAGSSVNDTFEFRNSGTGGFAWGNTAINNGVVKLSNTGVLTASSISGDGSGLTALKWSNITGRPLVDNNSVSGYTINEPFSISTLTSVGTDQPYEFAYVGSGGNPLLKSSSLISIVDSKYTGDSRKQLVNKVHTHDWNTVSENFPMPTWTRAEDPSFKLFCKMPGGQTITQNCPNNVVPSVPSGYTCPSSCVDKVSDTPKTQTTPCAPGEELAPSQEVCDDLGNCNYGYEYYCKIHTYSRSCSATSPSSFCGASSRLRENIFTGDYGFHCTANSEQNIKDCIEIGGVPTYNTPTNWLTVADSEVTNNTTVSCPNGTIACGIRGTDLDTSDSRVDMLCCQIKFPKE